MNSNNSNAVRKSGEELTNDCRLSIIALRQADHTFQKIADIANLSKSTVGIAIRKAKKGVTSIQRRTGRPNALTKRDLMHLKILLRQQPTLSIRQHWKLFCDTIKKQPF